MTFVWHDSKNQQNGRWKLGLSLSPIWGQLQFDCRKRFSCHSTCRSLQISDIFLDMSDMLSCKSIVNSSQLQALVNCARTFAEHEAENKTIQKNLVGHLVPYLHSNAARWRLWNYSPPAGWVSGPCWDHPRGKDTVQKIETKIWVSRCFNYPVITCNHTFILLFGG